MGLDQYAYAAASAGQYNDHYNNGKSVAAPRELAYWRKHPNLHGWMQQLWESKGNSGHFNGDELELTWQDLDQLEHAVTNNLLPATRGFFFGDNSDQEYRERDLDFIRAARAELFMGLKVFYNSSW